VNYFELCKNIQSAIDVEEKHQYVDFVGKKSSFSKFILSNLYKISKNITKFEKNKVDFLITSFEQYPFDSMPSRRVSVDKLLDYLGYFKKYFKKTEEKPVQKIDWQEELDKIDVMFVKGGGPKIGELFKKLGIFTVKDLLEFYPRKYIDYEGKTKISKIKEGESVSIFATIKKVSAYNTPRKLTVLNIVLGDGSGVLPVTFFYKAINRRMLERYKAQYPLGASVIACGKVKRDTYNGTLTLDKPEIQVLSCDLDEECIQDDLNNKIVPVYSLTENLTPRTLIRAISNAFDTYKDKIEDPIPEYIREKYALIDKKEAVKLIHKPKGQDDIARARFRLVFEELFIMQLNLALLRERNKKTYKSIPLAIKKGGLVEKFINNLPFELTNAQKRAVDEILNDLNSIEPMQRLLQGDVGSGKTVVACICLLCAIENGYQGALMAPTEILATQHYRNFIEWFTPLNLSTGLFLGKHTAKTRREMLASLKNGQMHVAIGTHALIQEGVEFNNLGAVVIDEQHRFGVKQRAKLHSKGDYAQMLTMTATPIPRTLALTVHGDLDLTIIDEMPKGRLPVKTTLITASGRKSAYDLIKEEIAFGRQAYIVYPLIDESETISAKNATQEHKKLLEGTFKNYRLGLLHGKLDNKAKDEVMADFKNKKYDILVSTTVVEVGVDVPNATVMIIENAERFGLSQLHQLRGRVGRSNVQSHCILVSTASSNLVRQRLGIMTQTNNGFIVAEKDLELRGPGEFLGTRQSGIQELGLADIVNDVEKTRNIADFKLLQKEINKKDFFDVLKSG
jgi:ATP-dependent DNA helicase RecG